MPQRNCLWKEESINVATFIVLFWANGHSHPSLQQSPPWWVSCQQHWDHTLHQQKDYNLLKVQRMVRIYQETIFKLRYVHGFRHNATAQLIDYIINITFINAGRPNRFNLTHFIAKFAISQWPGTKHALFWKHACMVIKHTLSQASFRKSHLSCRVEDRLGEGWKCRGRACQEVAL